VALLAVVACIRVDVYASAFPFFHNIDEHRHADRVLKYARGYWPEAELPPIEPHLAELIARYGTPEYTSPRDRFPQGAPPPTPPERMTGLVRALFEEKLVRLREMESVDAQQPPLYPLVAGLWYRLGQRLGFTEIAGLYFVRWLNGAILAALVVSSWRFLLRSHPDEPHIRLGVLLWIAFYPSSVFYGISDDVGMPLLGGLAFAWIVLATAPGDTRPLLLTAAGGVFALALLEKWYALSFLSVAAFLALAQLRGAVRRGSTRHEMLAWSLFALAAGAPVALWISRNLAVSGDALGMALKSRHIGIAAVPPSLWIEHPLFHSWGSLPFFSGMISTFWRGEVGWYKQPIRSVWLDAGYDATTIAALALAALACRRGSATRRVDGAALVAVFTAFAMLAAMSIAYQLDPIQWAGRKYWSTGRYCAWAVLPFAIAYVRGVDVACRPVPTRLRPLAFWVLLGAILGASTLGGILLTRPVFASSWNWYHLP
jgi:hypothetical protein